MGRLAKGEEFKFGKIQQKLEGINLFIQDDDGKDGNFLDMNIDFEYKMEKKSFQEEEPSSQDAEEVKELVDHIETAMQSQYYSLEREKSTNNTKIKLNFDIIETSLHWGEEEDNLSLFNENQSILKDESTDGEQDTIDSGHGESNFLGEENSFDDLMFHQKGGKTYNKLKKMDSNEMSDTWQSQNHKMPIGSTSKGAMELIFSEDDETQMIQPGFSFENENKPCLFTSMGDPKENILKSLPKNCHEKVELSDAETYSPEACQDEVERTCFLDESIILNKDDLILDKILEDQGNFIQKKARLHLVGCQVKRAGKKRLKSCKKSFRSKIQKKREGEFRKLKNCLKTELKLLKLQRVQTQSSLICNKHRLPPELHKKYLKHILHLFKNKKKKNRHCSKRTLQNNWSFAWVNFNSYLNQESTKSYFHERILNLPKDYVEKEIFNILDSSCKASCCEGYSSIKLCTQSHIPGHHCNEMLLQTKDPDKKPKLRKELCSPPHNINAMFIRDNSSQEVYLMVYSLSVPGSQFENEGQQDCSSPGEMGNKFLGKRAAVQSTFYDNLNINTIPGKAIPTFNPAIKKQKIMIKGVEKVRQLCPTQDTTPSLIQTPKDFGMEMVKEWINQGEEEKRNSLGREREGFWLDYDDFT